ncbi:hypothetical protein NM688_g5437 [Phlebia brevispora]|uniref:Uncharacterized protein n=1 Tax=Phlebia brevispora TaxID=194682 RepID=A0ACC1SV97_9APHY|nr:hypothetical protein NM688_g5437 [Phlebia brevispora]
MSGPTPSAIVAQYKSDLVDNYVVTAALCTLCYEYLLTLKYEFGFVYQRKWSMATWLFVVNRYLVLATIIQQAYRTDLPLLQLCYNVPYQSVFTILSALPALIFGIFAALRVFALTERNYYISAVVFLMSLVPLATNTYNLTKKSCKLISGEFGLLVAADDLLIAFTTLYRLANIIVVAATWSKIYRHSREAAALSMRVGYGMILLRDGSIYFLTLLLLAIVELPLETVPSFQAANPVIAITQPLQPILISRFLINLRQVDNSATDVVNTRDLSRFSIPNFRTPTMQDIIGPMGEPLYHGEQEVNDWNDEFLGDGIKDDVEMLSSVEDTVQTPASGGTVTVLENNNVLA